MAQLSTVRIKAPDGYVTINESDFDANRHQRWTPEEKAEPKVEEKAEQAEEKVVEPKAEEPPVSGNVEGPADSGGRRRRKDA